MNRLKVLKMLMLIGAAVSIAVLFFTKSETAQYVCFTLLMLLFAINATEDYKKDKKRISFVLMILCYGIALLQLVLLVGTLLLP